MAALITETLSPRDDRRFEEIYEQHFGFLVGIAVRKFRVPESEAETLAHEVFLSYFKHAEQVRDLRSWFVGAICHASRYYWRTNARIVSSDEPSHLDRIDPASTRILDSLPDQLAAREALQGLTQRDQEILRLRYFEGLSINELAERLGLKSKYTQKLVMKCLRRAEQQYAAKESRKGERRSKMQ